MGTYNKTLSTHQTLGVTAVDTVTLASHYQQVEVLNRSTSGVDIYCRVDGNAPTVGGDDCIIVPAGSAATIETPGTSTSVQLIASTSCPYSVTGTGA